MDPQTKLTTKAQEALGDAVQSAAAAGNPQVTPLHQLGSLIAKDGGVIAGLLTASGADPQAVGRETRTALVALPSAAGATAAQPQASRALLGVLDAAGQRAAELGDTHVATEPLLIALAGDRESVR
jgi:ATP-dependent Clp protease ATP-binding subunit ClpB